MVCLNVIKELHRGGQGPLGLSNHEGGVETFQYADYVHDLSISVSRHYNVQGGSNMTGTDLYVNKPHCAAAVRP